MAPAHPDSQRLAAGWQALERNDLDAAEAAARRVLAQEPQDIESQRLLGASLLFQERFQEALAPLRYAHLHGPKRGSGHRLGYCHLALGDFSSAVEVLEREAREFPDLVNARAALGVALVQLSRREEALAVFLEATRLDPGSVASHTNAGNVLAELGRHDEALVHLRQAVQAQPGLADLHFNLGIELQRLKRHDEARRSLQAALDIAPHMPYALGNRVWNELAACQWTTIERGIDELRRQVRDAGIPAAPF
ncbi:MAG: tetratricopeptide repeat protein, partial [Geminicoccales bacterium]